MAFDCDPILYSGYPILDTDLDQVDPLVDFQNEDNEVKSDEENLLVRQVASMLWIWIHNEFYTTMHYSADSYLYSV